MTIAAPAVTDVAAPPLAGDRSGRFFHWNAALSGLHGIQALVILALSFAGATLVTSPVVTSYLTFDATTESLVPAQRTLFELPIGPAVALFLLASAVAHFLMAWPLRGWYERRLAAGDQPLRWLEYSLSSSVMIIVIAALAGIQEIGTLVAIFAPTRP